MPKPRGPRRKVRVSTQSTSLAASQYAPSGIQSQEVHPAHMITQSLFSNFPVVIPISSNVCGPGFEGPCANGLDTSGCPLFCRLGCGLPPGPPAPTPALFALGPGGDAEREPGSTRLYRGAFAKGRIPPGAGEDAGDRCGCDALGGNA